ncbi:MAG: hypothetical protein ABIR70_05220 [Bryobacteraceae bacterium]
MKTPALLLMIVAIVPVLAQTTGTSTLQVAVGTEAKITVNTATTALTSSMAFGAYTGTTNFTYSFRTATANGTGTIQVQITSDFSPAGGPSVGTPPSPGDTLAYTCTVGTGTACSGSQTASASSQTSVATVGANAHIADATGSVAWSLTNDPVYQTGTYNATATFTISAS